MKLTHTEVKSALKDATLRWSYDEKSCSISQMFKFEDFAEGLDFVNDIGILAEKNNHHPDITLGWGYVTVVLTTHSEDGVTEKDLSFARQIDSL